MPFTRCMWYEADGTHIRDGCRRIGQCHFVHPSDAGWDRAPPSRNTPRGHNQSSLGNSSSQRLDGGWAQRPTSSTNVEPSTSCWGSSTLVNETVESSASTSAQWGAPASQNKSSSWGREPSPVATSWSNTAGGWGNTADEWGKPASDPDTTSSGKGNTLSGAGKWGDSSGGLDNISSGWRENSNGWGNPSDDSMLSPVINDGGWGTSTKSIADTTTANNNNDPVVPITSSSSDAPDSHPQTSSGNRPNAHSQPSAIPLETLQASSAPSSREASVWPGIPSSTVDEKPSATPAASPSPVHEPTLMDVDEAASPSAGRAASSLPVDGSTRTVHTLINAVVAYRALKEAEVILKRQTAILDGRFYYGASPKARSRLKEQKKQAEIQLEAAQRSHDEALHELGRCGELIGLDPSPESTQSSVTEDVAELEPLSTIRDYVVEIQQWIETARPQLKALQARRCERESACAPVTVVPNDASPSLCTSHISPILNKIDDFEVKISMLEDYHQELKDVTQRSLERVEDILCAEQQVATLSKRQTAVMDMTNQLAELRGHVDLLSSRPRLATDLETQRLRAEQEQLKLRVMELQLSNESIIEEKKAVGSRLDEIKARLDRVVTSSSHSPFTLTDGGIDVEQVVQAVEPTLRSQAREDVAEAIVQIKVGFDAAFAKQHGQICNAVWKRLWPALQLIGSIQQHFNLTVEGVPDGLTPQAEAGLVGSLGPVGPVGQS